VENITHVELAFMRPGSFNVVNQTTWDMFTTVGEVRPKFPNSTKIMVAIGGWGDTDGFSVGAKTNESRKLFAENIAKMVETTGADGKTVHIDNLSELVRTDGCRC
jgi:GH18 family chitinase